MIKHLLFVLALISSTLTFGQAVPNGGFENWSTTSYDNPDMYEGSNAEALRKIGQVNCIKTTDKQNGTYAIKVETTLANGDTMMGYFINGNPDDYSGGAPFSQSPTGISGYYKANIQPGDQAVMLVIFKKNGAPIAQNFFPFTTSQSSYTPFTFTLSAMGVTPDTVIIGVASSNFTVFDGAGIPGNYLQLDNLSFTGTGITQVVPNGNFENWTQVDIENPDGWSTRNFNAIADQGIPQALKIYVPYSGTFALHMVTLPIENGQYFAIDISSGKMTNTGQDHGRPYTQQTDTLMGYYKYTPSNTDSAVVFVDCYNNGNNVGFAYKYLTSTGTTYTQFKLPIMCSMVPDSMRVDFYSSTYPADLTKVGSALTLDAIQLKSDPLGIYFYGTGAEISVYPNPVTDALYFNLKGVKAQLLEILDISGKTVETVNIAGEQNSTVNTKSYPAGNYFYKLVDNKGIISRGKFSVTK